MRRFVLAACITALCAVGVRAQDASDPQLSRIVEAVRAKGLPTEPVVSKVRQGTIMHAPHERVVAAAEAVAARLEIARDALAPQPTPSDIAAGENALAIKGVTAAALTTIRAINPHKPVAVPVGVLAQLIASGVTPKRATDIVASLVKRNATNDQLVALGKTVNDDVARGTGAEASLNFRLGVLTPLLAPPGSRPAQALTSIPASGKP